MFLHLACQEGPEGGGLGAEAGKGRSTPHHSWIQKEASRMKKEPMLPHTKRSFTEAHQAGKDCSNLSISGGSLLLALPALFAPPTLLVVSPLLSSY